MTYVAFLRGINVGGHKLISMEELTRIFLDLGFKNVKTMIQSGNVVFEAAASDRDKLTVRLEKTIQQTFESETTVIVRTQAEIAAMLQRNPFKSKAKVSNAKAYVTFLSADPKFTPRLPVVSPHKDVEIFSLQGRDVFSLGLPFKDGRFGFPNALIEREYGVSATTRNWNTVMKLVP